MMRLSVSINQKPLLEAFRSLGRPVSQSELVRLEPKLQPFYAGILAARVLAPITRAAQWEAHKTELSKLVGAESENASHPVLGSREAYESVYRYALSIFEKGDKDD